MVFTRAGLLPALDAMLGAPAVSSVTELSPPPVSGSEITGWNAKLAPCPKTSRIMRGIFLILLALLLAPAVAAADRGDTRWYDVELIIFTPTGDDFLDAEAWPQNPQLPAIENARSLTSATRQSSKTRTFQTLTSDERQLDGAYRQLKASSQFEPLVHIGWRQPGLKKNEAVPVRITLGFDGKFLAPEEVPTARSGTLFRQPELPRLDGTVKVILSRYLHLETDLVYRMEADDSMMQRGERPDPAVINLSTSVRPDRVRSRDGNLLDSDSSAQNSRYLEFVVNNSRRMRSKELHYLDHPILGVIALITPS